MAQTPTSPLPLVSHVQGSKWGSKWRPLKLNIGSKMALFGGHLTLFERRSLTEDPDLTPDPDPSSSSGPQIRGPRALRDLRSQDPELSETPNPPISTTPRLALSQFGCIWGRLTMHQGEREVFRDPGTLDMTPGTPDLAITTIYLRARA